MHIHKSQFLFVLLFFFAIAGYTQVTVTASAGNPAGSYSTLKATFDKINDGTHQGDVVISITGNIIETTTAVLNESGSGSANYTTITISPSGGMERVVSGNIGSNGLVYLNGADHVTIDGLNTLGNALTFQNENNNAPTLKLSGNTGTTDNNDVKNCTILGSNLNAYGGVIHLQWANNNSIVSNTVGPYNGNRPSNLIYAGYYWKGDSNYNTISDNNLFDYGHTNSTAAAAISADNVTHWTIENNRIYQTGTITFNNSSFNRYYGIYIRNGSGHLVKNNRIGYSSANGTGLTNIILGTTSSNIDLYPIFLTSDGTATSVIENNSISSFNIDGGSRYLGFYPIFYEGTYGSSSSILRKAFISNNLIGSESDPNSLQLTTTGQIRFRAINVGNPSSSLNYLYDLTANNNSIGGIQIPTTSSSLVYFNGMVTQALSGANVKFVENTIGFPNAPIRIGDLPTANQFSYDGIYVAYGGYEKIVLDKNIIQHIGSASTVHASYGIELSKYNPSNVYTITNNTVRNLEAQADLTGIKSVYTPSGSLYSGNTIYNLTSAKNCHGLALGEKNSIVENNLIYGLSTSLETGLVAGIYMSSFSSPLNTIKNNIVSLGKDKNNQDIANVRIYSAYDQTYGASSDYIHNTFVVTGTGNSGVQNSAAFYRESNNYNSKIQNNILANYRSNNGGTGKHYTIRLRNNSALTIQNNQYFTSGPDGVLGSFNASDKATLSDWQNATLQDSNSIFTDPVFHDPTSSEPADFFPSNGQIGPSLANLETDFFGAPRGNSPLIGAIQSLFSLNSIIFSSETALVADANSSSNITVELFDIHGNPLTSGGHNIEITSTLGTIGNILDNGNGTYSAVLTSGTLAGNAIVGFSINGNPAIATTSVQINAGNSQVTTSSIVSDLTDIIADGNSMAHISVQLRDIHGNPLQHGGETIVMNTSLGSIGNVTDNGDGTYSAILTSGTITGTATIGFSINGETAIQTIEIGFLSGVADVTTSSISSDLTELVADANSTTIVTVQLKDLYGNEIRTGGDTISFTTTLGTLSSVTNHGNGTYSSILTTGTTTGTATVAFSINGETGTQTANVGFMPGNADSSFSTITSDFAELLANGTNSATITVQLLDSNNNPLNQGGENIAFTTTLGTLSGVTDHGDGSYSAILTTGTISGTATVAFSINGETGTNAVHVDLMPGNADTISSTIISDVSELIADGNNVANITIQLMDANGNSLDQGGDNIVITTTLGTLSNVTDLGNGTYSAILTSGTITGTASVGFSINGKVGTKTVAIDFLPGNVDNTTSTISSDVDELLADGTSYGVITIVLVDSNGNPLDQGGENVEVVTSLGTLSTVTDQGDGTYSATLTSGTVTGTATVGFSINGISGTKTVAIEFIPGNVDITNSTISSDNNELLADGTSSAIITIQLKDANGNSLDQGGDNIVITTTLGTLSSVTDHGNGTYSGILTSGTVTGTATVGFSINGIAGTKTLAFDFLSGKADSTNSMISADVYELLADNSSAAMIIVQLMDAHGNLLHYGGDLVEINTDLGTVGNVTDNGDGSYGAIFTASTVTGTATVGFSINGIAGNATISIRLIAFDSDQDGVPDEVDNCPTAFNPDQLDFDGDGIGDVCDDDKDGDGIMNDKDQCPNSPLGTLVDALGCKKFDLPLNNFNVSLQSPTCTLIGEGSIAIGVNDSNYNYYVSITGRTPIKLGANASNSTIITGLISGTYEVCFTVANISDYQQCFEVIVEERKEISAVTNIDKDSRELTIKMEGAEKYYVMINDETVEVFGNEYKTILPVGLNKVSVTTEWDCQGAFRKQIFVPERVSGYPNPTQGPTNLYIPGMDQEVTVFVLSPDGSTLFKQKHTIGSSRYIPIDLSVLAQGTYILNVQGSTIRQNFKIIKR
ncbi:invasin domain 3-containing protein [Sediminicola sp. 1XM1-17]|uniref:invasin domain 3-containing protein n=1 Tax=Sediminicola sp. 1XM1-17 TaxID=3127702 RepID=UPI003076FAE3